MSLEGLGAPAARGNSRRTVCKTTIKGVDGKNAGQRAGSLAASASEGVQAMIDGDWEFLKGQAEEGRFTLGDWHGSLALRMRLNYTMHSIVADKSEW